MISAHPTKAYTKVDTSQNVTLAACLNNTENKYDDKEYNLTFIPGNQSEKIGF